MVAGLLLFELLYLAGRGVAALLPGSLWAVIGFASLFVLLHLLAFLIYRFNGVNHGCQQQRKLVLRTGL